MYVAGLPLLLIKINRALTPYNFLLFATFHDLCFVHPIFLSFGFWYFGHFSCDFLSGFYRLALQNVKRDYVIFSYFRNLVDKSDQKLKTKFGMNETFVVMIVFLGWSSPAGRCS